MKTKRIVLKIVFRVAVAKDHHRVIQIGDKPILRLKHNECAKDALERLSARGVDERVITALVKALPQNPALGWNYTANLDATDIPVDFQIMPAIAGDHYFMGLAVGNLVVEFGHFKCGAKGVALLRDWGKRYPALRNRFVDTLLIVGALAFPPDLGMWLAELHRRHCSQASKPGENMPIISCSTQSDVAPSLRKVN